MKAIVIDDERLAIEFLENQLKKISSIEIINKYTHFDMSKEFTILHQTDIVFLDIEMPGVNGLELADYILNINPSIYIIFVTAYNHYAVKAFELNALDYLLKPIELSRLQKSIERLELTERKQTVTTISNELKINVCHELSFEINGQKTTGIWRTKKARGLFLYLLHHQGKSIHKSVLAELFWPKSKAPFSQLYTTIYYIRKCLQVYGNHIHIQSKDDHYELLVKNIKVDIREWEKKMADLSPVSEVNISKYEQTMELYTGDYLKTYSFAWAEPEKYRLEQLWITYATKIARWLKDKGDSDNAIRCFKRIIEINPEHEEGHFSLMKLFNKQNKNNYVISQYDSLVDICINLDIPINQEIKNWYQDWHKSISNVSL